MNQVSDSKAEDLNDQQIFTGMLIAAPQNHRSQLIDQLGSDSEIVFTKDAKQTFPTLEFKRDSYTLRLIKPPGYEEYENQEQFQLQCDTFFHNLNNSFLNSILIVCRYQRFTIMMENIGRCFEPFRDFSSIISIIITEWEKCDKQSEEESILRSKIQNIYKVQMILFIDAKSKHIFSSLLNTQKDLIQVKLNNSIFDTQIDPQQLIEINKLVFKTKATYKNSTIYYRFFQNQIQKIARYLYNKLPERHRIILYRIMEIAFQSFLARIFRS